MSGGPRGRLSLPATLQPIYNAYTIAILAAARITLLPHQPCAAAEPPASRPNLVFILADDK